ncbi:non-structural maintenance of chromosomes element 4 homolog A-like isoform X1 [Glossina fuscipes]|uniref:Non-structural maintenance of chromosomes element 4 n=1 Tax=Glossina fuscipes TaxID=7396 RepID=A0A9C5ZLS3_9MUSC|nr:non-structural maintenance of chromosomes element 4 homolog A-like isoform X1 [Glossina fuscipes]
MDISLQKSSERKQRYNGILDYLKKCDKKNMSASDLEELNQNIKNNDEIHKEGAAAMEEIRNNNAESLMDAHVLKKFHEVVSNVLLVNSEFNETVIPSFISKKSLINQGRNSDWNVLGEIATNVSRSLQIKTSMLGAADVEPKERALKGRQKRCQKRLAREQRPENVGKLQQKERCAQKVNILLRQLNSLFKANNYEPIPFYKLIIDPNNFMNTVENAFQMSFLVRDGNIAIERGEDLYPQVRIARMSEMESITDTTQAICSLSIEFCEDMIRLYGIKEPMIHLPNSFDDDESLESDHEDM